MALTFLMRGDSSRRKRINEAEGGVGSLKMVGVSEWWVVVGRSRPATQRLGLAFDRFRDSRWSSEKGTRF